MQVIWDCKSCFSEAVKFYALRKVSMSREIGVDVASDFHINKKRKFFTLTKCPFVLRFTDEISGLKEKSSHEESHTAVGRFIIKLHYPKKKKG